LHLTRCLLVLAINAATAIVLCTAPAIADSWPQRPVRIVVPVGAGGGPDLTARLFAERLAQRWKQPVVVENRPGADGLTGVSGFAGMRDDHVLLFFAAAPISSFPVIYDKLPYDPRDLVPIASATDTFLTVAASASLEIRSLAELVAFARARPGSLNYNPVAGALPYVFAGFLKGAGLDMVLVPYREYSLAAHDLAEGHIQVMISTMTLVLPQARAGKVRLLAVTNSKRAPIAPEVPTATEAGYPDLAFEGLLGFFGTRDMPSELRDRISADIREVASDPAIADRLAAVGQIARGSTGTEFAAAIEAQRAQIASIVQSIGLKPMQ
jgi:tripartite-type tricarboxylate transporter receptor subunit TctC